MSDNKTFIKAKSELAKWDELRRQLEEHEIDVQCVIDTLEGETELFEVLIMMSEQIADRDVMAAAVDQRIKDLTARKNRINEGTEALRSVITQTMDRAGIKKIPGELSTLSLTDVKPSVIINDESLIPSKYFKPQDPKIDKKSIGDALNDKIDIPGAQLSNGGIALTIRRK